ncbi:hypothetical protein GCK72_025700 [Caenorhabditis remanei]|uniref:Uncharacterized protein n=1 Tax=Caenorhabditis remanei TaxID=31234 RepID=A0A6A5G356_CAERE|nr:hypothetical protein GCK72_025700 [Caenorhabditis remanei]KAF1749233.1 hypothetical protein GCK72_025700 [Caenorhabditis remanei]
MLGPRGALSDDFSDQGIEEDMDDTRNGRVNVPWERGVENSWEGSMMSETDNENAPPEHQEDEHVAREELLWESTPLKRPHDPWDDPCERKLKYRKMEGQKDGEHKKN